MTANLFITAFALLLIFEGIGPLLFPNKWRDLMLNLAKEKPVMIRKIGLILVLTGSILLFLNN